MSSDYPSEQAASIDVATSANASPANALIQCAAKEDDEEEDLVALVHGTYDSEEPVGPNSLRGEFAPWHHPIKQIVRSKQWVGSAARLMREHRSNEKRSKLRYFTLPGSDLLDVRVLADALNQEGTQIEYFGFDAGYAGGSIGQIAEDTRRSYLAAESALRQSEKITDAAIIINDRLEDIAQKGSLAESRLREQEPFDIVNIDACDHLGYIPKGRQASMMDAFEQLLAHQLPAKEPWLLFITTRANIELLGPPTAKFQRAIDRNIEMHPQDFGKPLADCIGGKIETLPADMHEKWSKQDYPFLKLFSIGLGKYLLHYYHAQRNMPAHVRLLSAYAYKVSGNEPDMLSLAFQISPLGIQALPAQPGGALVIPDIELKDAIKIIDRTNRLWDLDEAILTSGPLRDEVVEGTERLLSSAGYDLTKWRHWLSSIPLRPMILT